MNEIKHILAPIGRVQSDQAVLDRAFYLAKIHQARLTILHIAEEEVKSSGYAYLEIGVKDPCTREEIDEAIQKMNSPVQTEVIMQKPGQLANKVLDQAQTCDLLVMGHRYRNFIMDMFFSNVESKVINRAPCDIYIVHLES